MEGPVQVKTVLPESANNHKEHIVHQKKGAVGIALGAFGNQSLNRLIFNNPIKVVFKQNSKEHR